jgi:hypothetical protein
MASPQRQNLRPSAQAGVAYRQMVEKKTNVFNTFLLSIGLVADGILLSLFAWL